MNNINLENEINNSLENNVSLENKQKSFLETSLGSAINKGINLGLQFILPDLVENQIIEVKDTILTKGFSNGIKKAVDLAIDFGKSALGIFTGKFENVNQIQTAVKKGGIIDSVGDLLETAIRKGVNSGKIKEELGRTIIKGKDTILNTINQNIENELKKQFNSVEKLEKYENNWKKYYQTENFDGMQREYVKIQEELKNVVPIENTINNAREILNMHKLIKNKDKKFDLTEAEKELLQAI